MRNKNKLLLLACALILQGCGDSSDRSKEYLTSAKSYYETENYDKAKLELKNALQINGKLGEAYYYLALVHEKQQSWKEMYASLSQAIDLNPENHDAKLKLAKLYLLSGDVSKAEIEINSLLITKADNPDVIALNGAVLLKQGDTQAALTEAEKALVIDPSHIDALGLMVGVFLTQEDYANAEKKINDALEKNSDELTLYLLKLRVHLKREDIALVEQDYQEIIKRFPSRLDFSYALAKFYVNIQRNTDAYDLLQDVVEKNGDQLEPKLILVDFLLQKDIKNAEATLNKFIKNNPSEMGLHFKLANLYVLQKKEGEAKKPLRWIVEHSSDNKDKIKAKSILARFAIQEGDNSGALTFVEDILNIDKRNYDALLLKARISLIDGSTDDAITDLRSILRDYSKSDEAMVLLGQAFLIKESPELAEENFRKALELNPGNFSAVMPVVSRMIESQDVGRAEELLKNALKIKPNHTGAMQALAKLRLLKKDWEGSQKVVDLIAAQPKGKSFANYLSGKISHGQGHYEEAISRYKLTLADAPTLSDALKSMIICYEELKQRKKMHTYLDEFIKKNPTLSYPLLYKGQLLSLDKNWSKAINVLNKGAEQWPEVYQFYESIAHIHINQNEKAKAIDVYNLGLKKIPDNMQLGLLLASVYESQVDYDNAIKVYERIVEKHSNADVAVNNLVSLWIDHSSEKIDLERAVELARRFETSKHPYFLDTYGWALLQNGNVKEAVKVIERVISKEPNVAVFNYHLGVAHYKSENISEAIRFLEKALKIEGSQQEQFVEKEVAEVLLKKLSATVE